MERANAKALLLSLVWEWIAARTSGPVRKFRQKSEAWNAQGNQNREIDGSRNSSQVYWAQVSKIQSLDVVCMIDV